MVARSPGNNNVSRLPGVLEYAARLSQFLNPPCPPPTTNPRTTSGGGLLASPNGAHVCTPGNTNRHTHLAVMPPAPGRGGRGVTRRHAASDRHGLILAAEGAAPMPCPLGVGGNGGAGDCERVRPLEWLGLGLAHPKQGDKNHAPAASTAARAHGHRGDGGGGGYRD